MRIIAYHENKNKSHWANEIRKCDWSSARFLADILEQNKFDELLGGGELFLLVDKDKLISFATLTKNDCVKDDTLFPWIGFVFTVPEHRGHRYSGKIIDFAYNRAIEMGFNHVYIATDHVGLYEKYGFTYIETRIDIYNEESRIYYK